MREGPNPGLGLAILRVVLGVIFITHGLPKLLGGVPGFGGFLEGLGLPAPEALAWAVTLLEVGGGLCLVVGFVVAPAALLLALEMAVAMVLVHAPAGWYVVGGAAQHPPGGVEFSVLLVAALLAVVLAGPGIASLDAGRGRDRPVAEA